MRRVHPVFWIVSVLVYVFLLFPLVVIALSSFDPGNYMRFPPTGFSLRWYGNITQVEMFMSGLKNSLLVAAGSTCLALILGIPPAYVLARFTFPGRNLINNFLLSPLFVPQLVVGMAFLQYLVVRSGLSIMVSLLIGHTLILIPYVMRTVGASLQNLSVSMEEASLSLGSSAFGTFFRIVLPNIRTGILAAVMLAFVTSFNNVPMSLFLSGPGVSTLPIQMMVYSEYYFDPTIAAISVVLILFTLVFVLLMERAIGLSEFMSGGAH